MAKSCVDKLTGKGWGSKAASDRCGKINKMVKGRKGDLTAVEQREIQGLMEGPTMYRVSEKSRKESIAPKKKPYQGPVVRDTGVYRPPTEEEKRLVRKKRRSKRSPAAGKQRYQT